MAMIEISALSRHYDIRRLNEADADDILDLCRQNMQFYKYSEAKPTREQVLSDMHIAPPGIGPEKKHYIGFYRKDGLAAVMDLIDGYPGPEIAFIGFFMMKKELQGRQLGSAIIRETAAYLKGAGKAAIRLAIDKENPQSTYFWRKNGFIVIKEVDRNGWPVLVAERTL